MSSSTNTPRIYEMGERNELPLTSGNAIYEGSALGMIDGTGLMRPLVAGDKFCGFTESSVNVLTGIGFATYATVRLYDRGKVQLAVAGCVVTDVGLPVYASDDLTFSLTPVGGSFVGFVHRFVSAGVAVVKFDALRSRDPYGGYNHVLKSTNYTLLAADVGSWTWVDTDAVVITLPAVAGYIYRIGNIAAFGVSGLTIAPNAVDNVRGFGITAADNKGLINTKTTSRRGDWAEIGQNDANGWSAAPLVGTWARVA